MVARTKLRANNQRLRNIRSSAPAGEPTITESIHQSGNGSGTPDPVLDPVMLMLFEFVIYYFMSCLQLCGGDDGSASYGTVNKVAKSAKIFLHATVHTY